jgi:hypothetical protein
MLYKAGTVKEMERIREKDSDLPEEIYREALRLVTILDDVYGVGRDVEGGDGGFVLIAENVQDLALVSRQYVDLKANPYEAVSAVQCSREPWLNIFFLCNNEFGINVFMPISIAPRVIIDDLKKNSHNQ